MLFNIYIYCLVSFSILFFQEIDPESVGGGMAKPMDLEVLTILILQHNTHIENTFFLFFCQAYIGRYSGHTKFARLNFIVERCPPLQDEALALLAQVILK